MTDGYNNVCLVDDDAEMRAATAQWLELSGYKVQSFPDAPTALDQLTSEFEGVVVSDIRMPRMDGMAFLSRLHVLDSDIPVVLLTAHGDVQMAVEAIRQGAYDFI
ncbi:MAG: response regulator, partial [Desulfuromonadales bacterium]|nr:response regulator [Desulfuromonadales bacterium]